MDTKLTSYLEANKGLLEQNKIAEFLELVYNDSLLEEEKAEIFTFVNDALQYFNHPNSYNFEYVPEGVNFSGTVYIGKGSHIKGYQFYNSESLQSIIIPNSVTEIEWGAFAWCTSLKSITIPDSVIEIVSYTFFHCESLQSVTIPDSVTEIGKLAFTDCQSLESITIPDSVKKIDYEAFSHCKSLQSVNLPKNLSYLGKNVFKDCKSLKEILIPKSLDPEVYEGKILKRPRKFV